MPKKPNTPQEDQQVLTDQEGKATEERKKVVEVLSNEDEKTIQEIVDKVEAKDFDFSELENVDGRLHKEIAMKLFEAGEGLSVAYHLDKFKGLNHKEIALKLIEVGKGWAVAKYLDKFKDLNHKEIALKLIEAGEGRDVAENLDKFKGLNEEVAMGLIKAGEGWSVVHSFKKFQDLDHKEAATKLIYTKQGFVVARLLGKFEGLDHKEIVMKLIETEQIETLVNNLGKFQDLDREVLIILCLKLYPEFQNYLENEESGGLSIEEFKNEFRIKEKHITPELILKFESIVRFAENHVSQTLKNKVKEYGYDPDTPDYKTQLSDDQKLELRQIMQDKQEDVRVKIQHIASPELIRAYQNEQEEGEADFLTIKAA